MELFVNILALLLWVGAAAYLTVILVILTGWLRTEEYLPASTDKKLKVTVVVAARNEEAHLPALLGSLEKQNYPEELFTVILADDHSEDDTWNLMKRWSERKRNVHCFRTSGEGKKAAIREALQFVTADLTVFTDADCTMGPNWLNGMASFYNDYQLSMILGPVVYESEENLLQKFFSLDFMSLVASGAGSVGMGLPLTANAANMAVSGKIIGELKKYNEGNRYASGDDVFLLHYIAKHHGSSAIGFLKSRQSLVKTPPPENLKQFVGQRIRWGSKAKGYRLFWPAFTALTVWFFNFMILVPFFAGFVFHALWILFILLIVMKYLADYPLLKSFAVFSDKKKLSGLLFPFEFLYPFYLSVTAIIALFSKFGWKGRKGLR